MDYKYILYTIEQSIGKIVLNRPDVLNSFIRPMALEVQQALDDCIANNDVRAVLITGAGRAFCAGQDLKEALSPGIKIDAIVRQTYNPIITKIRNIEKPVVCAVNGIVVGAGTNIALSCDIVVAAKSVIFAESFSKIGLIPDAGGTFFLPRLIGLSRTNALMLMDEKLTAEQAVQWGLIYKFFDDEKLQEEAFTIAKKLAAMPTKGLGLAKRALNLSLFNNLKDQLELEADIQAEAAKTIDHMEGVKAFLEKRKPVYKGE